jgi:hypothetical protein
MASSKYREKATDFFRDESLHNREKQYFQNLLNGEIKNIFEACLKTMTSFRQDRMFADLTGDVLGVTDKEGESTLRLYEKLFACGKEL